MHPPTASHIAKPLSWVLVGALGMGGILFIGVLLTRNLGSSAKGTFGKAEAQDEANRLGSALHNYGDASLVMHDLSGSIKGTRISDEPTGLARKIIYNSALDLVVEDFAKGEQDMTHLVQAQEAKGGYLVEREVSGSPGSPRKAYWVIRVPAAEFQRFLEAVGKLGELQRTKTDSKDVTEEYYDVEGRVASMKKEKEALQGLYAEAVQNQQKDPKTRMEDVLAVRDKVKQAEKELDALQGRLKLLTELTSLATVRVNLHERKGYVPATAPTFGTTISRTFDASIDAMVSLGKWLVVAMVALAPWLSILAVIAAPAWWLWRRNLRRRRAEPQSPLQVAPGQP